MTDLLHPIRRWRRGTLVAAGLAVGGVGGVVAMSTIGSAHAGQPAIDIALPTHTFVTMTPNIPIASDAPYASSTPTHTFVQTETTEFTETSPPIEATATTEPTAPTLETSISTTESPTEHDAPLPSESAYTVEINIAQVNCDGMIHVEYSTTADPPPAGPANHIVMFSPTGSPASFTVVETADNAPEGSFVFDGPGAPDLTYRVFVIGLFEPANPDGPKAIDEAAVVVVEGC
jgi:hypothetical protein